MPHPRLRPRLRPALLVPVLAVLLTGCGTSDPDGSDPSAGTSTPDVAAESCRSAVTTWLEQADLAVTEVGTAGVGGGPLDLAALDDAASDVRAACSTEVATEVGRAGSALERADVVLSRCDGPCGGTALDRLGALGRQVVAAMDVVEERAGT